MEHRGGHTVTQYQTEDTSETHANTPGQQQQGFFMQVAQRHAYEHF